MAIQYPVSPGTIIRCDYSRGGFQPPEMVKPRPAVVISPRLPHRDGLCSIVPLSTTPPPHPVNYVVELQIQPLPPPYCETMVWAKCDMVATVGFDRLDLFRTGRSPGGRRKYLTPKLSAADLERVRIGVLWGIGLGHLTPIGK
jgi:mRNA interferase MazF